MSLTVSQDLVSRSATEEVKAKLKTYNETVRRTPFPFPDYVKAAVDLIDASKSLPPNMTLSPSRPELRATLLTNMAATLKQDGDGQQVLKQLLGSGSPCGQAHPEKVQGICMSLGNHGGDDSVAKRETNRFLAERNHQDPLKQIINGIDARTASFNAHNTAQASIQALQAGALSAHGDLVVDMTRLSGRRRPGDDRPSVPDRDTQAWLGEVLGSDAFAAAATAYPHPDVLKQMKHMISLCESAEVKAAATGKFNDIATSLGQSAMLTDEQKQTVQRLQIEVVQLRVDAAGQLQAAKQILQSANKDLVDSHVGSLLRTGDPGAIDLAGQIVQSDEFLSAFGNPETAEALINVAEGQLLQEFGSGDGEIKTDRLLQAGMDLLPKAGAADAATDVTPALRVVDLLAKRNDNEAQKAAEKLLDHVFTLQNEVCQNAIDLQTTAPRRQKAMVDEFQLDGADEVDEMDPPAKLNKADALQTMAQISRTYAVYFPEKTASHANVLSEATKAQFREALDKHCWSDLAGLGEVADQLEWIAEKNPKLQGELLTRKQMINSTMSKAEVLWAEASDPAKKMDLADPANHAFMDALQCGLALASHDRDLCKLPLQKAKTLQQDVATKQVELLGALNSRVIQNSTTTPQFEQDIQTLKSQLNQQHLSPVQLERAKIQCEVHARLKEANLLNNSEEGLTYKTLRDLGQEVDLAVDNANDTAAELDAIGSHGIPGRKVAQLREDVRRFQGELKTGLEYSRAFTYTSGSGMSEGDAAIVSDFAKQASFAVSEATLELMTNDITHWDLGTTRMQNHINRQGKWDESEKLLNVDWKGSDADLLTARKALTNDMRLLNKYSEKLPTDKEKKDPHRAMLARLLDNCGGDLDVAVKTRAQQIKANPRAKEVRDAAASLMGTFAKDAGYLVEERAYQLLQDQKRTGWDDQNTTVIPPDPTKTKGKNTRPDLMQRLGGDKWVALDFTASNSSGHIFGKTHAWVSDKVTQVVEITYPSFQPAELERFMLEKAAIPPEAVEAAKEAAKERQALIKQTAKDAKSDVQDLYLKLRETDKSTLSTALREAGFNTRALVRWAEMGGTGTYGHRSIKGSMEVNSRRTQDELKKLTKSIQALKKVAEDRGIAVPPKVEQMARDGIQSYCVPPPPRASAPGMQPGVNAPPTPNILPALNAPPMVNVPPSVNALSGGNGHSAVPVTTPVKPVKEGFYKRKHSDQDERPNKKMAAMDAQGGSKPKPVNIRVSS